MALFGERIEVRIIEDPRQATKYTRSAEGFTIGAMQPCPIQRDHTASPRYNPAGRQGCNEGRPGCVRTAHGPGGEEME